MLKAYYADCGFISISLFVLYLTLSVLFLVSISRHFLFKDYLTNVLISVGLFFYGAIIIFDSTFDFLPYLPDTDIYTLFIKEGGFDGHISKGFFGFLLIIKIVRWFIFFSPLVFIAIQLALYVLSVFILWKAHTSKFKANVIQQRVFFILIFIYPSVLVYIPWPLRENIFLLFFSIFMYGINCHNRKKGILFCLIGITGDFMLRPLFAIILIIFIFLSKYKLTIINIFASFIYIPVMFILFEQILKYVTHNTLSAERLAGMRNWQVNFWGRSGYTYGNVEWTNFLDMLKDLPAFSLQFLLAPLPIVSKISAFKSSILFLDSIFIIALSSIVIFKIKYIINNFRLYMLLFISVIIVPALYEYYIFGACRHRMPAIFILILLTISCLFSTPKHKTEEVNCA